MTNGSWFVDSVIVTEPVCLPPVTNPLIVNPVVRTNSFSFAINTVSGRTYVIEYTTNLADARWQTLETLAGNGNQQTVIVPGTQDRQRFFRFVVE